MLVHIIEYYMYFHLPFMVAICMPACLPSSPLPPPSLFSTHLSWPFLHFHLSSLPILPPPSLSSIPPPLSLSDPSSPLPAPPQVQVPQDPEDSSPETLSFGEKLALYRQTGSSASTGADRPERPHSSIFISHESAGVEIKRTSLDDTAVTAHNGERRGLVDAEL